MSKPRIPPIAYGEYVSADTESSFVTLNSRLRVLKDIENTCPEMLKSLANNVFPVCRKLAATMDAPSLRELYAPYHRISPTGELKRALDRWAEKYNADAIWLKDVALLTLWNWHDSSKVVLEWHFRQDYLRHTVCGKDFEFHLSGWDVEVESWQQYRKSALKEFEKKLHEYKNCTRNLAESNGLLRVRRTFSPANLKWFVLYQFTGLSSSKIADQWSLENRAVDESTVLKGIKTAAKLLVWDKLRSPRRA